MKTNSVVLITVLLFFLILFTVTIISHDYHLVGTDHGVSNNQAIYTVIYIEEFFIFKLTRYVYFNSQKNMNKWVDMMGMEVSE